MHELHSAMFCALVPRDCTACRLPHGTCDKPRGLDGDGRLTRGDDPGCVVSWPACPGRYAALRRHGQDAILLSDVVEELHDRGDHRAPNAPAGLVRVVSEWRRCRKLPRLLAKSRAAYDLKNKAKGGR